MIDGRDERSINRSSEEENTSDKLAVGGSSETEGALVRELFDFLGEWSSRYDHTHKRKAHDATGREIMLRPAIPLPTLSAGRNERSCRSIGDLAAAAYAERRLRDEAFDDPRLFGEPAWEILLDVAAAEGSGTKLAVSSVCLGACCPDTTALRWIDILERRGLIRKEPDASDARRTFVRLSVEGARKLTRYFARVAQLRMMSH